MNKPRYLYELSEQDGIYSQAYEQFSDNFLKRLECIKKHQVNDKGDNPMYLLQLFIQAETVLKDNTEEIVIKPYELADLLKGFSCAVEHLPGDIIVNNPGICKYIQSHTEEFLSKILLEKINGIDNF